MSTEEFNRTIFEYYKNHKRDFPWRQTRDPYAILVSEIMLQQTQTGRVVSFYERFLEELPDFKTLAACPTKKLLELWQGLGYNRRALQLQAIAKEVAAKHNGKLSQLAGELVAFKGIGPNTAGAICAYAYNQPVIFIETNIRKVFIHFFFSEKPTVTDKEILKLVEETVDKNNPREWYWAVVDYGAMLGRNRVITNNRSLHYKKQSAFEGSNRQIRASLLKSLLEKPQTEQGLLKLLGAPTKAIQTNLANLVEEGFLVVKKNLYQIRN